MKKKYEKPEMEVIILENDVITSSVTDTTTGEACVFGDEDSGGN